MRLILHTAAYWLILTVRDAIPKAHALATAEFANPGEQTEGQAESETPRPASAGDRLILAIRFAAIGGPRFRR